MNKIELKKDYIYKKNIKKFLIYHMADIHFNTNTKQSTFNKILKKVLEDRPSYIIITGDLLDTPEIIKNSSKIKELVLFLTNLSKISKVIISLGNHDTFNDEHINFFKKINELNNIYVLNNNTYTDEYIYVYGNTLPSEYYYNVKMKESLNILLKQLNSDKNFITNLNKRKLNIGLFHSPICILDKTVTSKLQEFDLILSGHMHNGMIPNIISKYSKTTKGLVAPGKQLFPKVCRGRINKDNLSIIINGGITKLSQKSGKILSKLNFLYNKSINKIIITSNKLECIKNDK